MRIYQNEKVLMKELGLIADNRIIVTSEKEIIFEGTNAESLAYGRRLALGKDVVSVYGERL